MHYCLTLDYVFLDMRHPARGRAGRKTGARGRTGGLEDSHHSLPSAATVASSFSAVAPSASSAHSPQEHYL